MSGLRPRMHTPKHVQARMRVRVRVRVPPSMRARMCAQAHAHAGQAHAHACTRMQMPVDGCARGMHGTRARHIYVCACCTTASGMSRGRLGNTFFIGYYTRVVILKRLAMINFSQHADSERRGGYGGSQDWGRKATRHKRPHTFCVHNAVGCSDDADRKTPAMPRSCVRACVRVCIRTCVHACVHACVRARLCKGHQCSM